MLPADWYTLQYRRADMSDTAAYVVGVEVNVDVVFGGDVGQFCCVAYRMNSRGPNTEHHGELPENQTAHLADERTQDCVRP